MESINLRALDLNLLVVLQELLRTRSVSAAARALGLSQPATSRALGRLREVLRDPLLVQVGRVMVPTERALSLVEPVDQAVAALHCVFDPARPFDPRTDDAPLVIGLGEELQATVAAPLLAALWDEAPEVDVRLRGLSAQSADEARRGRLHMALVPDLRPLPAIAGAPDLSDFVVQPLYTRSFVVAARTARPMGLHDFLGARHLLVSLEGGARGFVDEVLAQQGLARQVVGSVPSFSMAREVVARTDLVATLPQEVLLGQDRVVGLPHPVALPELSVDLVWHPRHTHDPRQRFYRSIVAKVVLALLT